MNKHGLDEKRCATAAAAAGGWTRKRDARHGHWIFDKSAKL